MTYTTKNVVPEVAWQMFVPNIPIDADVPAVKSGICKVCKVREAHLVYKSCGHDACCSSCAVLRAIKNDLEASSVDNAPCQICVALGPKQCD